VDDFGAGHHGAGGRLLEQAVKRLALTLVECAEDLVPDR
jgi:hypothetical protein